MRRTTIAVSAAALTATLGACSQGGSTASSGGSGEMSAYQNVDSLVSGTKDAMNREKTFAVSSRASGAEAAMGENSGAEECTMDMEKDMLSCNEDKTGFIATPDAVFLKDPSITEASGDSSKPWRQYDRKKVEPTSIVATHLQSYEEITDLGVLFTVGAVFKGSSKEQVNGAATTRYEVISDLQKALAEAPPEKKQLYQSTLDLGVKQLRHSVWVDADGRPVKLVSVTPPMEVAGEKISEMTRTVEFKDWGKSANITTPPPNQVEMAG